MSTSPPDSSYPDEQNQIGSTTDNVSAVKNERTRPSQPAQSGTATASNPTAKFVAATGEHKRGPKKPLIIILILAVIGTACYLAFTHFTPPDKTKLRVSGRIEGYETNVGAKIAGKIDSIAVREGDLVKTGQMIVRLSDDDIQAQLRGAKARLHKAMDDRDEAAQQLGVVQSNIAEAQFNKRQSVEDAQGRIFQADANLAGAQANLDQAQAQLAQAEADLQLTKLRKDRYEKLAQRGAVAQDSADEAATNEATASATVSARRSAVQSARKQRASAQGALTQARTNRFNPGIRNEQLIATKIQMSRAVDALKAANQDIANAKADVDQITASIAYLNIQSPIDGVVTARPIEPGAVVAAGQTVLALINLNTVYLRGYVPEGLIGRVRVGQQANIFLDSAPTRGLSGEVIEIDPEASFTPENIYFRDDRVKQVFGIKIKIDNPAGFAKPGMPADADVLTPDSSR